MEITEILKATRELIGDPNKSVKGHLAVDRLGLNVLWNDRRAERFCLLGALRKVVYETSAVPVDHVSDVVAQAETELTAEILNRRSPVAGASAYFHIIDFHDRPATQHAEILEVLDLTIKRLETA